MDDQLLAEWEAAARDAADQLCGMVAIPEDIAIKSTDADGANGTNSLDQTFIARLCSREHLNDSFLLDK